MEILFLSLKNNPSPPVLNELCSSLQNQGWFTSRELIAPSVCEDLLVQLQEYQAQGLLKKAGIGQGAQQQVILEVRGDHIKWIDEEHPRASEESFLKTLTEIENHLNSRLYLGLKSRELHYAAYPPGTGYQKHLDVFQNDSKRVLSFVLYLNKHWQEGDGGELSLFSETNPNELVLKIQPKFSQCVIFLSDKIHHQVEFTIKERFSVTGWLKKASPTAVLPVF